MPTEILVVTLRPATAADADAVATIWIEAWPDGHLGHVPEAVRAARTEESFRNRASQGVAATTVAVDAGVIAGFVMVANDEVEQVYVSASYRGTGVAGQLLDAAERRVALNGHERAWLAVVAGNVRARRFYARHGWSDEGPFEYMAPGNVLVPCHRYAKRVAAGG